MCANMRVYVYMHALCFFLGDFFSSFACFALFKESYCILSVCFWFILFYYYSLGAHLFFNERQKGCGLGRRWGGEEVRCIEGSHHQNIVYEEIFSTEGKERKEGQTD